LKNRRCLEWNFDWTEEIFSVDFCKWHEIVLLNLVAKKVIDAAIQSDDQTVKA
jgi:hypothetical protein